MIFEHYLLLDCILNGSPWSLTFSRLIGFFPTCHCLSSSNLITWITMILEHYLIYFNCILMDHLDHLYFEGLVFSILPFINSYHQGLITGITKILDHSITYNFCIGWIIWRSPWSPTFSWFSVFFLIVIIYYHQAYDFRHRWHYNMRVHFWPSLIQIAQRACLTPLKSD